MLSSLPQDSSSAPTSPHVQGRMPTRRLPQAHETSGGRQTGGRLETFGLWLRDHQRVVSWLQWSIVVLYALLVILPALPIAGGGGQLWSGTARIILWGLWWPGVLLSILLFGRLWCGVLCPEGTLTAFASRHGRGRAIPRWMRWPGWPFTAFALTTVHGQMISVYDHPRPALLILGGSTLTALIVGFTYGREKRLWCRYLCPVGGIFGLLAKLSPLWFAVDTAAWDRCPPERARGQRFTCEPMVPVRTMNSASPCHMCGRCAGFRDAVRLEARLPGAEIVTGSGRGATGWDSLLIVAGLVGLIPAALHWQVSPWFQALRQAIEKLVQGREWPQATAPWWLLTNQPAEQHVVRLVEGAAMLAYLGGMTLLLALASALPLAAATQVLGTWRWQRFHLLTQCLLPVAALGVIVGLTLRTESLLGLEGIAALRLPLLWLGALWSGALMLLSLRRDPASRPRRLLALTIAAFSLAAPLTVWGLHFALW